MRIICSDRSINDRPLLSHLGVVGEETELTDSLGTSLKVGDVVYYIDGKLYTTGEAFVVKKYVRDYTTNMEPFIVWLQGAKFGKITGCSFEEFFNIDKTEYKLQDIIDMDSDCVHDVLSENRNPNVDKSKWYIMKAFDGELLPEGYCMKELVNTGIHEVDDGNLW